MTRKYVAEQWDRFQRETGVLTLPPGMRKMLRRAYYAGAWMVTDAAANEMSQSDEMTEGDEAVARGIHEELVAFAEDVKAGRA